MPDPRAFLIWRQRCRQIFAVVADSDGATAIEFALVAPLFLTLLFGIIGYGIFMGAQTAVTAAATEGARASVQGLTSAERTTLARAAATAVLSAYAPLVSPASASVTVAFTPSASPTSVVVTVTYPISLLPVSNFSVLLPFPTFNPSATVSIANGGF